MSRTAWGCLLVALLAACGGERKAGDEAARATPIEGVAEPPGVEPSAAAIGTSSGHGLVAGESGVPGKRTAPVTVPGDQAVRSDVEETTGLTASSESTARVPDSAPSPAESRFLQGGALRADAFEAANDGPGWDAVVRDFERDGLVDPDARDLHLLFGEWLRSSLARYDFVPAGFGCGRSLCAATIAFDAPDARQRYDAWRDVGFDPPMSVPVFADSLFISPDGRREMRILFSTDPATSAIKVR